MFSKAYWDYTHTVSIDVWRASIGFMRTYTYLIQYETDFRRAMQLNLIPTRLLDQPTDMTYETFSEFISQFEGVDNSLVSPRYHYGSLRLSRLNYLAPLFLRKPVYFHVYSQWMDYFRHLFAPFIATLGTASVVLSAMQVELAVEGLEGHSSLAKFTQVSRWVSVIVLVFIAAFVTAFLAFLAFVLIKDQIFALRMTSARKKGSRFCDEQYDAVVR